MRTAIRTCPLCEATCGLRLTLDDADRVVAVEGDGQDVLSRGYLCPKGALIGELHADPDRLRRPRVRRDGRLVDADWDEAFEVVADRLRTDRGRARPRQRRRLPRQPQRPQPRRAALRRGRC